MEKINVMKNDGPGKQDAGQGKTTEDPKQENRLMKELPKENRKAKMLSTLMVFAVVSAGVATGWVFSGPSRAVTERPEISNVAVGEKGATEAGIADTSQFKEEVEGVLERGGIEGEGTHHLVRNGGPTKNVYLTSGVIDLEMFVGKKVKVWGNSLSGTKAGWLFEAGKISVIK
jgi:hypothetical protein